MREVGFVQKWNIYPRYMVILVGKMNYGSTRYSEERWTNPCPVERKEGTCDIQWLPDHSDHLTICSSVNPKRKRSDEVQHLPASTVAEPVLLLSWRNSVCPRVGNCLNDMDTVELEHNFSCWNLVSFQRFPTADFTTCSFQPSLLVKIKQPRNDHVDTLRKETSSSSERICNWVLLTKSSYLATQQCGHTACYTLKHMNFLWLEGIPPYFGQVWKTGHGTGQDSNSGHNVYNICIYTYVYTPNNNMYVHVSTQAELRVRWERHSAVLSLSQLGFQEFLAWWHGGMVLHLNMFASSESKRLNSSRPPALVGTRWLAPAARSSH